MQHWPEPKEKRRGKIAATREAAEAARERAKIEWQAKLKAAQSKAESELAAALRGAEAQHRRATVALEATHQRALGEMQQAKDVAHRALEAQRAKEPEQAAALRSARSEVEALRSEADRKRREHAEQLQALRDAETSLRQKYDEALAEGATLRKQHEEKAEALHDAEERAREARERTHLTAAELDAARVEYSERVRHEQEAAEAAQKKAEHWKRKYRDSRSDPIELERLRRALEAEQAERASEAERHRREMAAMTMALQRKKEELFYFRRIAETATSGSRVAEREVEQRGRLVAGHLGAAAVAEWEGSVKTPRGRYRTAKALASAYEDMTDGRLPSPDQRATYLLMRALSEAQATGAADVPALPTDPSLDLLGSPGSGAFKEVELDLSADKTDAEEGTGAQRRRRRKEGRQDRQRNSSLLVGATFDELMADESDSHEGLGARRRQRRKAQTRAGAAEAALYPSAAENRGGADDVPLVFSPDAELAAAVDRAVRTGRLSVKRGSSLGISAGAILGSGDSDDEGNPTGKKQIVKELEFGDEGEEVSTRRKRRDRRKRTAAALDDVGDIFADL